MTALLILLAAILAVPVITSELKTWRRRREASSRLAGPSDRWRLP